MAGGGGGGSSGGSQGSSGFEEFLGGWMVRQEHYLDELVTAQGNGYQCGEEYLNDLTNRILSHYGQYYEEKSRFSRQDDVLWLFSPSWFSPLEVAYLWVAGFKPGLAIRVLRNSVHELCEEQDRKLSRVAEETRMEERQLNDWVAKIQESLAAPPLLKLARQSARRMVDGERTERDDRLAEETEKLRAEMQSVVDRADLLRRSVVARVVEILNPVQNIQFLAAVTKLQLTVRKCGLAKDEEIRRASRDWRHMPCRSPEKKRWWVFKFFAVCWCIWRARNEAVFKNKNFIEEKVMKQIYAIWNNWMRAANTGFAYSAAEMMRTPTWILDVP